MLRADLTVAGRCWFPLAVLLLPAALGAREPALRFERISLEQGLSQSTVNAIVQDSRGFLWLGTQDGLNRYDGYDYLIFRNDPNDSGSLSNNLVRVLLADQAGALWVGTDGGLNRFDPVHHTFTQYRHRPDEAHSLSHDLITAICEGRSGALWIGTDGGGINRLDRFPEQLGSDRFTRYRHQGGNSGTLSDDQIRVLYEDRAGVLWVGTGSGGLDRFDRDAETFTHYRHDPADSRSLGHDHVRAIYEDREGALWIGTDGGGLNKLDRDAGTFTHYRHDPADPRSLSHNELRAIYEDRAGSLWIGTDGGGLNRFDRSRGVFLRYLSRSGDRFSLSNNFVRSIYEDRSEVLWVGTDGGGLNKLDRGKNVFNHYRHDSQDPNSLSQNMVFSILQDHAGDLWIGTWGGLNRLDRETGRYTHYRHDPENPNSLSNDEVWPIYEDRSGALWIGTFGGLNRLDGGPPKRAASGRESESFTHYRHDPRDPGSLSDDYVRAILEDRAGALWIGTRAGLNEFDRRSQRFRRYLHDPEDPGSLSHDDVRSIFEDRSEVLWLATAAGGLNRFGGAASGRDRSSFTAYRAEPRNPRSLCTDFVRSIAEDRRGTLWIGTDDGLTELDRERRSFTCLRTADGLPNNVIYGILEDDHGALWLSTNGGLSRFDPEARTFRNYDVRDGLQGNEFNTGAFYKSPSGELFFGGINGLNSFRPERLTESSRIPPVVITEFRKLNEVVRLSTPTAEAEKLELSYRDSVISFKFAALDFRSPGKNRYAAMLEGFHRQWIELGTKRDITFTNLDPGRYRLRVKGSNHHGAWNEEGAALEIFVAPPPWKTWWAYALYVLALSATVSLYLRSHARKLAVERAIAEKQRTVAREMRHLAAMKDDLLAARAAQISEREGFIAERELLIDELEGRNAELERFNYTVSHDLKSPLVTIKGFLGMLERDTASVATDRRTEERIRHDIDRIHAAADKMHRLLDELLNLSRMSHEAAEPEAVRLDEVAREALGLVAGEVAERGVEVSIDPALPVVMGDRVRLREVYQNLLANAVKYMGGQQRPRVEVGVRSQRQETVFYVRDNGSGVDPRYHDKIFGLFERLATGEEGTGIGLALVQRIVEIHGGRVWIESEGEGRGSTFCFTLGAPAAARRPRSPASSPRPSTPRQS